jgi:hypothetical protein
MTEPHESILSDLADGLAVDPSVLAAALQEPEAARTLVAFVAVQHRLSNDQAQPSERFYTNMRRALASQPTPRRTSRMVPAFAVAVLWMATAVGAALLGRMSAPSPPAFAGEYCTDSAGTAHRPGSIVVIDGLARKCVTRGDWLPVVH